MTNNNKNILYLSIIFNILHSIQSLGLLDFEGNGFEGSELF